MGALRNLIMGFDDSDKLQAEAKAHLETLSAYAESKADLFEEKIRLKLLSAGVGPDKSVPITQILDTMKETHAYTTQNANDIAGAVNGAIDNFVQGGKKNVTSGVEKLISSAITALFGYNEADEQTIEKYMVAVEGVALVRLDFIGWKRAVTAESLVKKVEQVSAFMLVKSTIDIMKTDFNSFLDVYQGVVLLDNPDAKTEDVLLEAKKLFDLYKDLESKKNR